MSNITSNNQSAAVAEKEKIAVEVKVSFIDYNRRYSTHHISALILD